MNQLNPFSELIKLLTGEHMAIKLQPNETIYQVVYKNQSGCWEYCEILHKKPETAESQARAIIESGKGNESQIQTINRYMSFSLFVIADAKPEEYKEGAD